MLRLHTHVHTCTVLHTRAVHIHTGHTQRAQTPLVHACASRAHTYTAHRHTLHTQLHGTALHTHIARCTLPRHPHAHRGLHAHTERCTRSMHPCIALHALTRGALHTHGVARSQRCTLTRRYTLTQHYPHGVAPFAWHCSLPHGAARSPTPLHTPPVAHPPPLHAQTRSTPPSPPSRRRRKLFPGGAEPPAGRGGDPRCCPVSPRLSPASRRRQIPADPLRSPVLPAGPGAARSRCPLPAATDPRARPTPRPPAMTSRGGAAGPSTGRPPGAGVCKGKGGVQGGIVQSGGVQGVLVQNGHMQGVWELLVQGGLVQNGHVQWGREPLVQNRCVQGV